MEHTGIVKWYDMERGFGIIIDQSGEDVFVHHTRVAKYGMGYDLRPGQQVRFDMVLHQDVIPSADNVHTLQ